MRFMTNAEDFGQFGAHTAKELTGGNADMKKFYNNPEMNVSVFAAENVVTDSTSTAMTAEQQAKAAIDNALGEGASAKAITIDITSY